MYGKALSEIRVVAVLMKKFSNYCGEDFTGFFKYASNNTEINLGTHAIDFRNFVELETGFYITDSDWINTGIFTWGKLVEHLNKGVYNITPLVEDEEGFELAMKRSRDILVSFKVPEDNSWYDLGKITGFSIKCKTPVEKPYNPVKNISYNKFKRCAAGLEVNLIQGVDDTLFMYGSDCGKYYYWEAYNCNNELIYFRGEKSWVEDNYTESVQTSGFSISKEGIVSGFKVDTSPNITDKVDQVINRIKAGWEECNTPQNIKDEIIERYTEQYNKLIKEQENKVLATFGVPDHLLGEGLYKCMTNEVGVSENNGNTWTDKHYDFTYTLTEEDIESGKIKIDPYFVNRMWRINSWDDTGAAFHSLKNYARICNGKNPLERDLKSLYKQVKRLCELHKVDL